MRKYIKDSGYYYELDDTVIENNEEEENVYFYKSYDNFKTFELVYKKFNIAELKIYEECDIRADLPPYHDYVEPKWYKKLMMKFVSWRVK